MILEEIHFRRRKDTSFSTDGSLNKTRCSAAIRQVAICSVIFQVHWDITYTNHHESLHYIVTLPGNTAVYTYIAYILLHSTVCSFAHNLMHHLCLRFSFSFSDFLFDTYRCRLSKVFLLTYKDFPY